MKRALKGVSKIGGMGKSQSGGVSGVSAAPQMQDFARSRAAGSGNFNFTEKGYS